MSEEDLLARIESSFPCKALDADALDIARSDCPGVDVDLILRLQHAACASSIGTVLGDADDATITACYEAINDALARIDVLSFTQLAGLYLGTIVHAARDQRRLILDYAQLTGRAAAASQFPWSDEQVECAAACLDHAARAMGIDRGLSSARLMARLLKREGWQPLPDDEGE